MILYWTWNFAPVLFQHKNILGFTLLDVRITGLKASSERKSIFNRLPSQDASMILTHYPYQYYLATCFERGDFPLWNPLIGSGAPVTSDPQYKPFNPFFWPFFAFPSAWLFSLGIAAMALAGLLGWTLFLRDAGLEWPAVVIGTCLMVLSPLTQQTIILSSAWAAWMAPWALWAAERWHHRGRGGLPLMAGGIGLMVFVGHPLIALLYTAIVAAYLLTRPSDRSRVERGKALAAIAGLTLLLTAAHTLPLLGTMGQYWSYKSRWDGGPYCKWLTMVNPKSEIYVPMPFWGMAFVGLLHGTKRLRLFFLGTLAYGVVVMFPWVQGPVRWVLTFGGYLVARYGEEAFWLGLIGLIALGIDSMARQSNWRERTSQARAFVYGVCWYYGLCWLSVLTDSLFWPKVYHRLAAAEVLACLPVLLLLALPMRRRWLLPATTSFVLLLSLAPKLPFAMSRYYSSVDPSRRPPAIVEAIRERVTGSPGFRMSGAYYKRDFLADLCPNQNLAWDLADVRVTSPLLLRGYKEFADHWNWEELFGTYCLFPGQDPAVLQFLGVRWFVSDLTRPLEGLSVRSRLAPLALQEVPDAAPWVRPVGRWEVVADSSLAQRKAFDCIRSGAWRNLAMVNADPGLSQPVPEWTAPEVTWLETGPNHWRWQVDGNDASLLLVVMNDHPGWRARLDGSSARILRAYGTFMAVAVPAGRHEVSLTFHAPWFQVGVAVSILGWLTLGAWALLERWPGRPQGGLRS